MDRRWQLVLDCLDCEKAPFSKGTLVKFRALLISYSFDRRLIEKTVEMAKVRGGYNSTSLRIALDSSPLWGAARVEDTYNLLGHALRKALSIIAESNQDSLENVALGIKSVAPTPHSLELFLVPFGNNIFAGLSQVSSDRTFPHSRFPSQNEEPLVC